MSRIKQEKKVRKGAIGRPPKYTQIIKALEDDTLYTPGSIARFAHTKGFLTAFATETEPVALIRRRIRIALRQLSANHKFPVEGDGLLQQTGQPPRVAWLGWRWKDGYLRG